MNKIKKILLNIIAIMTAAIFIISGTANAEGGLDDIKNDKESELHIQREDEIGVLSSSLIEMKEEIDRQNEIKEEMIHNISK